MNKNLQLICVWCGPAFAVIFFIETILAGLLPPPSLHANAASVAHFWSQHGPFAWNGLFAFWLVAVLFGTWFVVMSAMMMRAVKRHAAEPQSEVALSV